MKDIRILIADDHAIVRFGLSTLLQAAGDIKVVGLACDGEEAVRMAENLKPDVIIMDLQMPRKDGTAATREILRANPQAKILILTTFGTSNGIAQALDAGVCGALMKTVENAELIAAIRRIAEGERVISQDILDLMACDPPIKPLSQRQLQILELIAKGCSSKEISEKLDLQKDSVDKYVHNLLVKIGASSRTEAVAIAIRKHLLKI